MLIFKKKSFIKIKNTIKLSFIYNKCNLFWWDVLLTSLQIISWSYWRHWHRNWSWTTCLVKPVHWDIGACVLDLFGQMVDAVMTNLMNVSTAVQGLDHFCLIYHKRYFIRGCVSLNKWMLLMKAPNKEQKRSSLIVAKQWTPLDICFEWYICAFHYITFSTCIYLTNFKCNQMKISFMWLYASIRIHYFPHWDRWIVNHS